MSRTYEKVIALGPLPYEIADGVRAGFDKLFGPTGRLFSKGVKIWEEGVPSRVAKVRSGFRCAISINTEWNAP